MGQQQDTPGFATDPAAPQAPREALKGLRVLIVEDERLVALTIEEMLAEIGCVAAGVAASVKEALWAVRSGPAIDAAILDVNLGPEQVFPVADELAARGVPFVFSTGYGPADLSHRYPGRAVLHKPYRPGVLALTLSGLHGPDA